MPGGRRTGADELLAASLASGLTIGAAATAAGVSRRTAERRAADPEFAATVAEIRRERLGRSLAKSELAIGKAVDRLVQLIDSANESVALGAIKVAPTLLDTLTGVVEVDELKKRVGELERSKEGTP